MCEFSIPYTSSNFDCAICLNNIQSNPIHEAEEKRVIDCNHIFHRECIDEWLKKKQTCPLCRTYVQVAPEARRLELTTEELSATPDSEILPLIRTAITKTRRIRRIGLHKDTPSGPATRIPRTSGNFDCAICLDSIQSDPIYKEEEKRVIDCNHIFHRECIGEWLKKKQTCPLCRTYVQVAPEARRLELTTEELSAIPDSEILPLVRTAITKIKRIRQIDLYGDTPINLLKNTQTSQATLTKFGRIRQIDLCSEYGPMADTARKVNAIAARFFGWAQ